MEYQRLIRITKNKIYLTPDVCLSLQETSLKGGDLLFKTAKDIYLRIEIVFVNKTNNSIEVRVVEYDPKNTDKFNEQAAIPPVSFIVFKTLIWKRIEPLLSVYSKSKLARQGIIFDESNPSEGTKRAEKSSSDSKWNSKGFPSPGKATPNHFYQPIPREPIIENITETAKIYFEDAEFHLGFVDFSYSSKQLRNIYKLKIDNTFLLPEFNAVKSYFPKALGCKNQFSIIVKFTLSDKAVTTIVTSSAEIDRINDAIIDSIKRLWVTNLTATPLLKSTDKSLFTATDIFDNFTDEGNVFGQTEVQIVADLIGTLKNVRNAKQLRYLSGSKHSATQKLRFTLHPLFGFLFFIKGENNNHYCWELLHSHATYLWSFPKDEAAAKSQFKRVEHTINVIRVNGREAYKSDYRNNKIDTDLGFCSIEHSDINTDVNEGFTAWQAKLAEHLT